MLVNTKLFRQLLHTAHHFVRHGLLKDSLNGGCRLSQLQSQPPWTTFRKAELFIPLHNLQQDIKVLSERSPVTPSRLRKDTILVSQISTCSTSSEEQLALLRKPTTERKFKPGDSVRHIHRHLLNSPSLTTASENWRRPSEALCKHANTEHSTPAESSDWQANPQGFCLTKFSKPERCLITQKNIWQAKER